MKPLLTIVIFAVAAVSIGCAQPTDRALTPTPAFLPTASTIDFAADRVTALRLVESYEGALARHDWQAAWDELGVEGQAEKESFESFSTERAAFMTSTGGRFVVADLDQDLAEMTDWIGLRVLDVDLRRAFLARVNFPALATNNAGWELYLVAPTAMGTWRLWELR
jgi:hypothetical protein